VDLDPEAIIAMELHLLGTTGYYPNDLRHTPCMMVPSSGLILDAGTGMYRVRQLLQTPTLDIFLTHAHLDHVVGLTYLLGLLYDRPMRRVSVHGDGQKLAAIERHLFSPSLFPVQPPFQWRPLEEQVQLSCGGRVSWFPLDHPGGSLGYRIDWPNRSLAYITDTTADVGADYVEKIRGVDLLLHECFFPDGWEEKARLTGHSCLSPVLQVARAAEVGRLILVHINPLSEQLDPFDIDSQRAIFPATEVGCDGMIVEF
jgi:ribonuclease BN (tRNA processing enzyme)